MIDESLLKKLQMELRDEKGMASRYWWYNLNKQYPFVFKAFSNEEKLLLLEWYKETDKTGAGECNISLISFLIGLLSGNPHTMNKIVQLGHYNGFSSLILGFTCRAIGRRKSIYSVDIDSAITSFTQKWIDKAKLNDIIHLEVSDSANPELPGKVAKFFGQEKIDVLFIDSSHIYEHTVTELKLWYSYIRQNGFIILHDISSQAIVGENGGVKRAFKEFIEEKKEKISSIAINGNVVGGSDINSLTYQDGCGVGIIQKLDD